MSDNQITPEELLSSFLDRYDCQIELACESLSLWSAELRFLLSDDENIPSRSMVFYSAAGQDISDAIDKVCREAMRWLEEGNDPLPCPDEDPFEEAE